MVSDEDCDRRRLQGAWLPKSRKPLYSRLFDPQVTSCSYQETQIPAGISSPKQSYSYYRKPQVRSSDKLFFSTRNLRGTNFQMKSMWSLGWYLLLRGITLMSGVIIHCLQWTSHTRRLIDRSIDSHANRFAGCEKILILNGYLSAKAIMILIGKSLYTYTYLFNDEGSISDLTILKIEQTSK